MYRPAAPRLHILPASGTSLDEGFMIDIAIYVNMVQKELCSKRGVSCCNNGKLVWYTPISGNEAGISALSIPSYTGHEIDSVVNGIDITTLDTRCRTEGRPDNDIQQRFWHIQVYCNFCCILFDVCCVVDRFLPLGYQIVSPFNDLVEQTLHAE